MTFDFNEANILKQNLFAKDDTKEVLISRLEQLLSSTSEPILQDSVTSLIYKIEQLSSETINQLLLDILNKKLIATSQYRVLNA